MPGIEGGRGGISSSLGGTKPLESPRVGSVNAQLEHWIKTSGLTKKELARRVQARAHAKGLLHVSTAASRVRGWIAGQQPIEAGVAFVIAEVLAEACRRPLTPDDLGFDSHRTRTIIGPADLVVIPRLADAVESQSRMDLILSAHDLDVERTTIAHGESLLDVVEHVALGRPASLPDPASSFCIEHQHVMLIEQTTNIFRRWDNEFGGGLRRKAIIGQLNEASNMLAGPFRDEKVGRRFYSAVADLTQLAGWMSYDLEFHATAQRYFLLGMHLARDAGDRPQVARMLYCLARQMIDLGRYAEALDLAQTGAYAIRRSASPKATAMLLIIQARAYAGMGKASECSHALGMAQDAFSQAGPGTDPEWCAFFDEGELYGSLGVALRDLALASEGEAERYAADARPWIERAIEHRPAHFLRSRVMDMDSLAVVNILLKEPESAIETASIAISMADRVASSRVISRLRRTGRLAQTQFPQLSAIADLADQTRAIAVRSTDRKG
jgi:hypothetical protein